MFTRAIALFLAVLIGLGTIIPLATQQVQAEGPHKHRKHAKHYKKYSKAWWRQYRARMKRKRARQAAARALRLQQLRLANQNAGTTSVPAGKPAAKPVAKTTSTSAQAMLPSGDPAPAGWKTAGSTPGELQFRVDNSSGDQVGSAAITVVGPSSMASDSARAKSVGGVPTSQLRRDVIDRMIKENGWVVNDYQKEIGGQAVYVVEAQSQGKSGGVQSRMFYFTEVDGLIYSVMTNSATQESQRIAEESEKVIHSLKNRMRPTQRASVQP